MLARTGEWAVSRRQLSLENLAAFSHTELRRLLDLAI